MSFSSHFDRLVRDFCHSISSEFNISEEKCYQLWTHSFANEKNEIETKNEIKEDASLKRSEDPDLEITKEKIMEATKDGLIAMCKKKGLKQSGKKEELYKRLMDSLIAAHNSGSSNSSNSNVIDKKVVKNDIPKVKTGGAVVDKIREQSRVFEQVLRKNKFGYYMHTETFLVFNTDKIVHGRQNMENGSILDLTVEDIEICKKFKFPYKIPENLNSSKNLNDIKIEEIEDEVLDEDDIEEEEEEEEEIIDDEDA